MITKTAQLKKILLNPDLSFLMEAHNGLSAKIVEETGFEGIWASGLSISAGLGVRDNNEASWTQVLEVVEFMADGTSVPILLDGDTGYGNFNNLRRLVNKLEQRGVAGVCIEDKLFPKTNSFIDSEKQPLADMIEFSGKIKAAKDTQRDENFCVVARVEALIAGWGIKEALTRAEAYRQAGADAILMHSKLANASEIEMFMKEWGQRLPVVIVPTKYYSTPTQIFKDLGVSTVIWANHNCRAAITSMQQISRKIFQDQSLINVEGTIATVDEVFRLQGDEELRKAEAVYLPAGAAKTAIILAATRGDELGILTEEVPKTLLKVGGNSILSRQIEEMRSMGINEINVVCGYGKDKIEISGVKKIENNEYATTSDLYSLYCARENLAGDTVISYGDIVFKEYVLHSLLSDKDEIVIVVDCNVRRKAFSLDLVNASVPYNQSFFSRKIKLEKITSLNIDENSKLENYDGEFIGLWKISASALSDMLQIMNEWDEKNLIKEYTIIDLINKMSENKNITIKYISGSWMDIDSISDLQESQEII